MNEPPPLHATEDFPSSDDNLEAGLAAAFGPDSGPPLPAGGSVLRALRTGLPAVPRIRLREPNSFGGAPLVRPPAEMPDQQDPVAGRNLAASWSFWTTEDRPDQQDPAAGADSEREGTIYSSEKLPDKQVPRARLQLLGEIGRGGMGAVLRGHDVDLNRDVAVKVLLETHQGKTELLQRFVEEAQISGQLQHPGITPVYELGQLADKRLYFTMKLVKGKTLAALLAARTTPDEERTRYIGIFAQVCQTLAYAHARGVIHRDLKPSNVMVGAFGEVQVMDWGLAKVLKEGGSAEEQKAQEGAEVSAIRTQRSEGSSTPEPSSQTQAGTMLGTPAYMAPEQARGDIELIDERADVFGLGAILCEILTGQPPYGGKREEIAYKARTARREDALARLDACGADGELIALTRHCLAAEPWERPRHAGEVAEQVTAYQQSVAERLRQAELAQTEARARAEEEARTRAEAEARLAAERWARRLTLGLAAAVLLTLTLAGGGGLWYQQQVAEKRAETARQEAEKRAEGELREAELQGAVRAALDKVKGLRTQARWGEARAVLEQARQRLGPSGSEDLWRQIKQAEADLALVDRLDAARLKALTIVGNDFDSAAALREYAAALREAGIGKETEAAEVVAERIRASAVREQLVAAVDDWAFHEGRKEPARRAWLLAVARAADPGRNCFRDEKVWKDRSALERLARSALERLARADRVSELSPQMLFALGDRLRQRGGDAVPLWTAAQQRYPSDFWLNFELGNAWNAAKRWEEAIGYYRAALALRPATSAVYANLGIPLYRMGRVDDAIDAYQKALKRDPNLAYAHGNLGNALYDKGRLDDAIAEYKKAIELAPKLVLSHLKLGDALYDKGCLDEAIVAYQEASTMDPQNALTHNQLGTALHTRGRVDEAIVAFKKALAIAPEYPKAHNNLGVALQRKGHLEEAIAEWKKALKYKPGHVAARINLARWEPIAALQSKLPAFLAGKFQPRDNAERLRLARLCAWKKYRGAAAQLYADAFTVEPLRANDLNARDRYDAACQAALAAAGQGEDVAQLDGKERARWRKQALAWLRADLTAFSRIVDDGNPHNRALVRQLLHHWQRDAELSGIRDAKELAKLPADERQACEKLWAAVTALLEKTQSKK